MKKIFILILCSTVVLKGSGQADTKTISLFNNKFSISIPADVDTMSAENIQLKYKTRDEKSLYYADKRLDFTFIVAPVPGAEGVEEDDMVKHKDDLTNAFLKYKPEENTVKKINGHSLVVLSYYTYVPGGKIFNRRFFSVVEGKLILVVFSSYGDEMEKRKQQIEQSINSVIIK